MEINRIPRNKIEGKVIKIVCSEGNGGIQIEKKVEIQEEINTESR